MKNVKFRGIPREKDEIRGFIPRFNFAVFNPNSVARLEIPRWAETVGPRNDSSIWVIQLYLGLLVYYRLQRSSYSVDFRISLALTQVFDDFLFEVTFRVDISITDQFVYSNATVRL